MCVHIYLQQKSTADFRPSFYDQSLSKSDVSYDAVYHSLLYLAFLMQRNIPTDSKWTKTEKGKSRAPVNTITLSFWFELTKMNSASRHRQGIQPKKKTKQKQKRESIRSHYYYIFSTVGSKYRRQIYTVLREDQQQRVYDVLIIICHK